MFQKLKKLFSGRHVPTVSLDNMQEKNDCNGRTGKEARIF
jgi:hypothetical protein